MAGLGTVAPAFPERDRGIMIISQASPIAQQQVHMTAVAAGTMVGLLGIFNAAGPFFWAWISDYLGRARVYFFSI